MKKLDGFSKLGGVERKYLDYILYMSIFVLYLVFFYGFFLLSIEIAYAVGFEELSKVSKFKGNYFLRNNFFDLQRISSSNIYGRMCFREPVNFDLIRNINIIFPKGSTSSNIFSNNSYKSFSLMLNENYNKILENTLILFPLQEQQTSVEFNKYFGLENTRVGPCKSIRLGLKDNHALLLHFNDFSNKISLNIFTKNFIPNCTSTSLIENCGSFGKLKELKANWLVRLNRELLSFETSQFIRESCIIIEDRKFINMLEVYSFINSLGLNLNEYISLKEYSVKDSNIFKKEIVNFIQDKYVNNFEKSLYFKEEDKSFYNKFNGELIKRVCEIKKK